MCWMLNMNQPTPTESGTELLHLDWSRAPDENPWNLKLHLHLSDTNSSHTNACAEAKACEGAGGAGLWVWKRNALQMQQM